MKSIIKLTAVAFCAVCSLCVLSASAKTIDGDERLAVIDQEMNCVSNHVKSGVSWDDVCYTSPGVDKDRLVSKTMDQMIEEHSEDSTFTKSVDDIVTEQGVLNNETDENTSEPPQNSDSSQADQQQYTQYAMNNGDSDSSRRPVDFTPQGSLSSPPSSLNDRLQNQSKSEIGFEYNRQRYVEPVFDLVDKGTLLGGYVSYTGRPGKSDTLYDDIVDMYKAELRVDLGRMDYHSSGSGELKDVPDFVFEGRLMAGKDFKVLTDSRLTPYLGFGFRYLNDDSGGKTTSTGAQGYDRESRYLYIPLGAEFTTRLSEGWLVSPNLEYDIFISGTQSSHLSDANSGFPDVKNKQRHGFGLRGSLKFVKENNPINFVFEPYIRYWSIRDSDETTAAGPSFLVTGLEPKNKTTEYGVRLGAQF